MDHIPSKANDLTAPRINGRRNNFWEPIFSTEELKPFAAFDWSIENITGIRLLTCSADGLKKQQSFKPLSVIKNFKFSECDFLGEFDLPKLTFKECSFEVCDLGRSTWRNVKFQNCTFHRCSLTQSTLDSCQFIDCRWFEIGLSGNETHIRECLITNPGEFVRSGYTNLDAEVLAKNKKEASYQTMRLEQSKLKVARLILTEYGQRS